MLQAWISSRRGSLYFAAPLTAYNLETLRTHVRALRDEGPACTCLSLNPGGPHDGGTDSRISALVAELRDDGVDVRVSAGREEAQASSRAAVGGGSVTPPRRRRRAPRGRRSRDTDARRAATSGTRE